MIDDQQRASPMAVALLESYSRNGGNSPNDHFDRNAAEQWMQQALDDCVPMPSYAPVARRLDEWHEDYGAAVWWSFDSETRKWLGEPAWIGSPDDSDWPGYHTHWTPHPAMPAVRPQGVK